MYMQTIATQTRKTWAKVLGIALLFIMSGLLVYPNPWNAVASKARSAGISIPDYWKVPFRLGLDLQGGAHLVYEADFKDVPEADRADALEGVRDVIERRVNAFGVAEPLIESAKTGDAYRINVELAGITDVNAAIKQIGETPILEFKVPKTTPTDKEKQDKDKQNAEILKSVQETLKKVQRGEDLGKLAAELSSDESKTNNGLTEYVSRKGTKLTDLVAKLEAAYPTPWKGLLVPKVLETNLDYWIVKVVDVRRTLKEYRASHILICYDGATRCEETRSKDEASAKANELLPKLNRTNFAAMAKANSDEGLAQTSGGDLDFFLPTMMVKPFSDAVAAMPLGTIAKTPVETEFGYHLIYKTGERVMPEYQLQVIRVSKALDNITASNWDNTNLSGRDLQSARVEFDSRTGEPQVGIEFNKEGGDKFAEITKKWIGQPVGIFLDGELISSPVVQAEITGGRAQISGRFTIQEAKLLARRLNAGALPVPINLVSQTTVGATLGADSLAKSMTAGAVGFLLVVLFMILYYRLPGIVAAIALLFYTAIVLAIYKLLPVTLSLSGIAGFIITLGMAVDANVLLFERLREELTTGRTLGSAIEEAWKRAWTSIFDGNITTLFSALFLFWFTSSVIKGFALTLAIGVIVSMWSAITVTRFILRLLSHVTWAKNPWLYGVNMKKE